MSCGSRCMLALKAQWGSSWDEAGGSHAIRAELPQHLRFDLWIAKRRNVKVVESSTDSLSNLFLVTARGEGSNSWSAVCVILTACMRYSSLELHTHT